MCFRLLHARYCWGGLLLLALLGAYTSGHAQEIHLDAAISQAIAQDPARAALLQQAAGERVQALAAGQLPDPQLSLGYRDLPADSFSPRDDMMSMAMISVRQEFPAGDSRRIARQLGENQATQTQYALATHDLNLALACGGAWLDWRLARQQLALRQEALHSFTDLLELISTRVATGSLPQAALIQAQLQEAQLRQQALSTAATLAQAEARLARWLQTPLPATAEPGALPSWQPEATALRLQLPQHPALQLQTARSAARQLDVQLQEQAYKPQWMLELGYGRRPARDAMGQRQPDSISAMVGLSLPLFTGARQDASRQAALAALDASQLQFQEQLLILRSALEEQLSVWRQQQQLLTFYQTQLLPAASANEQALLRAYANDQASFDALTAAHLQTLQLRLEALQTQRQRDQAWMELRYLSGEPHVPAQTH